MPTLSASDYTSYLKFKAAAASPILPSIQTRANATLFQGVVNANVLASQAALIVNPTIASISGTARVQPRLVAQSRANTKALSTLSFAGMSGAMGSSAYTRPGGLPTEFKGSQNTYHRIPQNAGAIQGNMISSGPKQF